MLKENKIISVLTIENYSVASDLAKCLFDSGIRNLEITLRSKQAKKAIEQILKTGLDSKYQFRLQKLNYHKVSIRSSC